MRVVGSKVKAMVGGLVLASTGLVAVSIGNPASAEAAGNCLGNGNPVQFSKPSGDTRYPASGYLKTSSKCRDINLSTSPWYDGEVRAIKVCFKSTGCQSSWTNVKTDSSTWQVIATNVKDNTEYYFKFYTTGEWHGSYAD